jgi:hypothetical protein
VLEGNLVRQFAATWGSACDRMHIVGTDVRSAGADAPAGPHRAAEAILSGKSEILRIPLTRTLQLTLVEVDQRRDHVFVGWLAIVRSGMAVPAACAMATFAVAPKAIAGFAKWAMHRRSP